MTPEQLERRVRHLTQYAVGLTLVLVVLVLGAAGPVASAWFDRVEARVVEADTVRAAVVVAERVDVVQPDGRLAVVVSNGDRIPGPIFQGEEFPPELSEGRRGAAGLVFYNADGTESGGLIHRTVRRGDGYEAFGALTFDQFEQDQVVALAYDDDGASRTAGLRVWDRSTALSIKEMIDMLLARESADPAVRDAAEARFQTAVEAGDFFGPQRVFVGSADRTAEVRLQDTAGRPRIQLLVDSSDVARLVFLDAEGRVVLRLPEE